MPSAPPPSVIFESIEAFAQLTAALADRFAVRESVMTCFGVDESSLRRAAQHWGDRLRAADGAPLRDAYRAAYQRERSAPGRERGKRIGDDPTQDARFLSPAQPFRREAAGVPLMATPPVVQPPLAVAPHPWRTAPEPAPSWAPTALDETMVPVQALDSAPEDALPFVSHPVEDVRRSVARLSVAAPTHDGSGDTLALDASLIALTPRELPFDGAEDDSLSLDQYAACQAELSVWPDDARAILARHGLDDEAKRRRVTRTWERRFARDPNLRAKYTAAVGAIRRYLAARGHR